MFLNQHIFTIPISYPFTPIVDIGSDIEFDYGSALVDIGSDIIYSALYAGVDIGSDMSYLALYVGTDVTSTIEDNNKFLLITPSVSTTEQALTPAVLGLQVGSLD